ncbi:hypothetical protein [Tenacibaculum finnmarkense]|uniref:hypothetical protein n=1 Tax=Tenacibaculum finnmarkense TaxID=2781243 RepID=UPI002300CF31|nr:hypothetical protein [Tenacibaculum finnmarkense]WCC46225.1 hypothetical protein PJH08_07395 [Tenacibaculum finnmarkense]
MKFKENIEKFKGNFVADGIVNISEYNSTNPKILWILKEANSIDDYDWDFRDALKDLKNESGQGIKSGWANTFTPIIYTTYGILNDLNWEDMGSVYNDQSIIEILNKVAYINLKKVPGDSNADWNKIKSYYNENKNAIHEQIQLINPDIIIFGNTMNFLDNDFFEIFGEIRIDKSNKSLHIYENKEKLLLSAYHPNNRTIKQQEYCNLIIESVRAWKNK